MDEPHHSHGAPVARLPPRLAVLAAGLLAAAFALGALAPALPEVGESNVGGWLRLLYAPVCHQQAERCLAPWSASAAACARCTGLYLGGAAGLLLFAALPSLRLRRGWFLVAVAPTLLDVAAPWLGLPGLSNLPRFLASIPTGTVLGLFLAVALADLVTLALAPRDAPRPVLAESFEPDPGGNP